MQVSSICRVRCLVPTCANGTTSSSDLVLCSVCTGIEGLCVMTRLDGDSSNAEVRSVTSLDIVIVSLTVVGRTIGRKKFGSPFFLMRKFLVRFLLTFFSASESRYLSSRLIYLHDIVHVPDIHPSLDSAAAKALVDCLIWPRNISQLHYCR